MTVSIWNRKRRNNTRSCDVVVIGAGICGLSMAIELEHRGLSVVVIDKGSIGSGASTRNAGYLMRGTAELYATAIEMYGRDLARTLWRWTEENLAIIRSRVPAQLVEDMPSALSGHTDDECEELERSHTCLRDDGFDVELRRKGDDTLWKTDALRVALINPNDARCNSRVLIDAIATQVQGDIIEHAEVHDVVSSDRNITVHAEGVSIMCSRVVHCTNAWLASPLLPAHVPVEPNRAQMMAIRAPGVTLDCNYYLSRGSDYIRTADNGLVLIGGCRKMHECDERTHCDETTGTLQSDLDQLTMRTLGLSTLDVVARWSGAMGYTPDGLPVIGPIDREQRIWVVGGFNSHGMGLAARCAQAAVGHMVDGEPTPTPLSRFAHLVQT